MDLLKKITEQKDAITITRAEGGTITIPFKDIKRIDQKQNGGFTITLKDSN